MNNWFSIKNKGSGKINVSIHDEIGMWGVTAAEFLHEINAERNAEVIDVDIHSPGGSMLDGFAIYSGLKGHQATINTHVGGIAASAASTILMAGDNRSSAEDGFVMIHNPSNFSGGESEDLRDMADTMDKFKQTAINIYMRATGKTQEEISTVMQRNKMTWFSAKEALEFGLINEISPAVGISNKASQFTKYFSEMPFVSSSDQVKNIGSIKDFEKFLRDSGDISRGLATALTSRAKVVFQGDLEIEPVHKSVENILARLSSFKVPS